MKTHALAGKSTDSAFTLVELVVVIATLVLLALFLIPMLTQSGHRRGRRVSCASNLKQIGLGIKMYAGDHQEKFPDSIKDIDRYLANQARLFHCPDQTFRTPTNSIENMTAANNSYLYRLYVYDTNSARLAESSAPGQLLMCDKNGEGPPPTASVELPGAWGGNHQKRGTPQGGNFLFVDGHVEWYNVANPAEPEEGSLDNAIWRSMTTSNGLRLSAWENDRAWQRE